MLFGLFSKKNTHKEQKDETPSQDSTNDKSINGEVNFLDLEGSPRICLPTSAYKI